MFDHAWAFFHSCSNYICNAKAISPGVPTGAPTWLDSTDEEDDTNYAACQVTTFSVGMLGHSHYKAKSSLPVYIPVREAQCKAGARCFLKMLIPTEGIHGGHQCRSCKDFYHVICSEATD
jgi:hypothetical protein